MITDPPIGRDEARELARRELEKPIYNRDRPSWLERLWEQFSEWLRDLSDRGADPTAHGNGGGWVSVIVILILVAVLIALAAWLMRGGRNTRSRKEALNDDPASTASDHRTAAEAYAAAGDWPNAIRERLRAIARDLEERAVLAPRPGRTADELAAEAGEALPELAAELAACVRLFDDVWYGDRPGSEQGYGSVRALDERLRATRPRALGADDEAAEALDGGMRW
ncbi:DUF4129 domain-containing protein [Spirillospora sp. CA-294931]|uniref:DUF4129 domain-containing protein n=1 Tax=Spirillospora sp. CA-294931 TaxID=3240042 RepID=UPI003D8C0DA3